MKNSSIINLDKPAGLTSQQAVSRVRRTLGLRRAGHCGTLDPDATGVLIVCTGAATRLADFFQALPKTYRCVMKLGERTDTQDASGRILERRDPSGVSEGALKETLAAFVGRIEQMPPMYSALKQNGVPLYRLARRGENVARRPRVVTVRELFIDDIALPFVRFTVRCSKGLYVRTLCDDVGERLGVGAHLSRLVRSAVGAFRIEDAVALDVLTAEHMIDPAAALDFMKVCRVPDGALETVRNGGAFPFSAECFDEVPGPEEPFQLQTPEGLFLGIGLHVDDRIRVRRLIPVTARV